MKSLLSFVVKFCTVLIMACIVVAVFAFLLFAALPVILFLSLCAIIGIAWMLWDAEH